MHKATFTPENAAMLLIDHQLDTMGGHTLTTSTWSS
jgi:hypothetical protein